MVFEDANGDARLQEGERGLAGLRVRVAGPGRRVEESVSDGRGVVVVELWGAGVYTLTLLDRPGPDWLPTTPTAVELVVGDDDAASWDVDMGLAFGLRVRRVSLWLAFSGAMLLAVAATTIMASRRAAMIRGLGRAMEQPWRHL